MDSFLHPWPNDDAKPTVDQQAASNADLAISTIPIHDPHFFPPPPKLFLLCRAAGKSNIRCSCALQNYYLITWSILFTESSNSDIEFISNYEWPWPWPWLSLPLLSTQPNHPPTTLSLIVSNFPTYKIAHWKLQWSNIKKKEEKEKKEQDKRSGTSCMWLQAIPIDLNPRTRTKGNLGTAF